MFLLKVYFTINIGHWEFFNTVNGLLPAKKVLSGLLEDEPITMMWFSPACSEMIFAGSPTSKDWLCSILFRRKNFVAHLDAFL